MHRLSTSLLCALLAGCAAHQPLPRLSLKDPVPQPHADSSFFGLRPVIVSGGEPATNQALALAMFHAINLARIPINTEASNWTIVGEINGRRIVWTVVDDAGRPRGRIDLEQTGELNLDSLASAAVVGLKPLLPRVSSPAKQKGTSL